MLKELAFCFKIRYTICIQIILFLEFFRKLNISEFLNKKIEPNVATNLVHAIQVTSHYNNLSYYMSNETFL